jgi:ribosomal protein S18 acetylase RimI-like enzyme
MARSKRTSYSVRADILQSLRWSTMANHLGFRSVAAWLTSLAENGVHDFDEAIYTMSRRRQELYKLSEEEEGEKPLKVNVQRAYRVELDRLFQLALSVPELQASNQRVFMDKGEFNLQLFEIMNTVTLVAERRGRILDFLYATLEETSARIVFLAVLPEYRRGIGTALHHELKAHIPREVAFVGVYALFDRPVIPFLEKSAISPASSIYGWIATRDRP